MTLPHFDLIELIEKVSYVGIFAIVFAESGLFFGFFFPGDSLLFTAGFLASQGILNIFVLLPLIIVGAIGGDSAGYWTGKNLGKWLEKQKDSFFFKKRHLIAAEEFYAKHGGKALVIARFIPGVRTFVPIAAGISKMKYQNFITFNIVGGFLWGMSMTLLGFFLGSVIPGVDKYLLPILAMIIIVSVIPAAIHLYKDQVKGRHSSEKDNQ